LLNTTNAVFAECANIPVASKTDRVFDEHPDQGIYEWHNARKKIVE
jgi:hypothetical protein